jgi:hypothetical protein
MAVKPAEGFWELWGVYRRLTVEERGALMDFAEFQEGRRRAKDAC